MTTTGPLKEGRGPEWLRFVCLAFGLGFVSLGWVATDDGLWLTLTWIPTGLFLLSLAVWGTHHRRRGVLITAAVVFTIANVAAVAWLVVEIANADLS